MRAFSSCGKRGLLFSAVRGFLTAVASLVVEHGQQRPMGNIGCMGADEPTAGTVDQVEECMSWNSSR